MDDFLEDSSTSIFNHEKIKANYKIVDELGRGGMGVVYKALQLYPEREVAIKVILRQQSQTSIKRFHREMELTAALNHPYIAKVYDFICSDTSFCLIMEYITATPLDKYLEANKISVEAKIKLFKEICTGLFYAHENNIIHRDLKSDNILITTNGTPKIIDFGLAKRMGSRFDLTKSGEVLGTPRYMAPEQIMGKSSHLDHQCDIYTMGVILYEMVTGKKMIEGESHMEIFYNIQYQKLTPPSKTEKSINSEMDKIWKMATARNKKERYQSLQDMIFDIETAAHGGVVTRNLTKKFSLGLAVVSFFLLVAMVLFVLTVVLGKDNKIKIDFKLGKTEQSIIDNTEQKNYLDAIIDYKKTKNINYNNFLLDKIARCYLEIKKQGIQFVNSNNLLEGRVYLNTAIDAFPNDVETIYYLAKAYLPENIYGKAFYVNKTIERDLKETEKYLHKCIELDPYTSKYFLLLGKIEFSLGAYHRSCQNLQQALELDKQNIEAITLLYKIPYEEPSLQRECYQYLFNLVDSFDDLTPIDLYKEEFITIENNLSCKNNVLSYKRNV